MMKKTIVSIALITMWNCVYLIDGEIPLLAGCKQIYGHNFLIGEFGV